MAGLSVFVLVAFFIFFILFLIWTKKNWYNLVIKLVFFGMSVWTAKYAFILWIL